MTKKNIAQGVIYFVEAVGLKRIKIGYSENFQNRFRVLENSCPVPLKMLKLVRGSQDTEQALMHVFGKFRTHGEWFRAEVPLLQFIRDLSHKQFFSPEMLVRKNFARIKK